MCNLELPAKAEAIYERPSRPLRHPRLATVRGVGGSGEVDVLEAFGGQCARVCADRHSVVLLVDDALGATVRGVVVVLNLDLRVARGGSPCRTHPVLTRGVVHDTRVFEQ